MSIKNDIVFGTLFFGGIAAAGYYLIKKMGILSGIGSVVGTIDQGLENMIGGIVVPEGLNDAIIEYVREHGGDYATMKNIIDGEAGQIIPDLIRQYLPTTSCTVQQYFQSIFNWTLKIKIEDVATYYGISLSGSGKIHSNPKTSAAWDVISTELQQTADYIDEQNAWNKELTL